MAGFLTEPVPIDDEFCMGLAAIEDLGSCVRFVLFSEQTCFEAGNLRVCVVRKKIVIPFSAVAPALQMTSAFMARRAAAVVRDRVLHLVT